MTPSRVTLSPGSLTPRMYKQVCATYESASLRMFHLGRTDTIRSASMDSLAFVKAMDDPSETVRGPCLSRSLWDTSDMPRPWGGFQLPVTLLSPGAPEGGAAAESHPGTPSLR